jgi:hypothetical protein
MQHVQGYTSSHWMLKLGKYSLRIAPATARATAGETMMIKYTYFAGHFNGHGNAPVHYHMHYPMEEVKGFTRSHWMLPLGKYYWIPAPVFIDVFLRQQLKTGPMQKEWPQLTIRV